MNVMNAMMTKAYLQPEGEAALVCGFNPSQLSVGQTAEWQQTSVPRANVAAAPQYIASQPRTLNLELFFDRSTPRVAQGVASVASASNPLDPSVEGDVERLMAMTQAVQRGDRIEPPRVTFGWGVMRTYSGYVKSVNATYLLFSRAGYPYRAKAQVEFVELPRPVEKQNPTSGSENVRTAHRVAPGDSLQSVAFAHYGNPRLWRGLAAINNIDDPMRLPVGIEVLLPEEHEIRDLS